MNKSLLAVVIAMGLAVSMGVAHAQIDSSGHFKLTHTPTQQDITFAQNAQAILGEIKAAVEDKKLNGFSQSRFEALNNRVTSMSYGGANQDTQAAIQQMLKAAVGEYQINSSQQAASALDLAQQKLGMSNTNPADSVQQKIDKIQVALSNLPTSSQPVTTSNPMTSLTPSTPAVVAPVVQQQQPVSTQQTKTYSNGDYSYTEVYDGSTFKSAHVVRNSTGEFFDYTGSTPPSHIDTEMDKVFITKTYQMYHVQKPDLTKGFAKYDDTTVKADISKNSAAIKALSNKEVQTKVVTIKNNGEDQYGVDAQSSGSDLDTTIAHIGNEGLKNERSIKDNAQAISTNTASIETVKQRVDGHDSTLVNHEQRISDNRTDINSLGEYVNKAGVEINKLQDASKAALEVAKEHAVAIDKNTSKIANHEERITHSEEWQAQAESSVNELIDAHNEVVNEVNHYSSAIQSNSESIAVNSQRLDNVQAHQKQQDKTISSNHKQAMAGVSSAMAMAGLHYVPAANAVAIGAGNYAGGNAVAIGYQHTVGNVRFAVQNSLDSAGNVGTAASMSVGW